MSGKFRIDGVRCVSRVAPAEAGRFAHGHQIRNLLIIGANPRRKLQRELRPAFMRIND
jgi:hypothetical protein